eukprot:TRINITY_DN8336_c0_g1_i1.p1 TRINITY_DN8336_c0_g1~~TRINITY_DN8336_c0_g1_i1.p1  ORF type:complete len:494 (+),score=95.38 TRINITY_DN8336_c0_g1_i1:99-1580(+)
MEYASSANTPRGRAGGRQSLKNYSSVKRLRSEGGEDTGKRRKKRVSTSKAVKENPKSIFMSPGKQGAGGSPVIKGRVSRTVPNREQSNFEVSRLLLKEGGVGGPKDYSAALAKTIFTESDVNDTKVLTVGKLTTNTAVNTNVSVMSSTLRITKTKNTSRAAKQVATRIIPQVAERVLDAPCVADDYRLSLIDWSKWANMLAVALNDTLYSWDAVTGASNELCSLEDESNAISSVSWIQEGGVIAIGNSNSGSVLLYDASRGKHLAKLDGHSDRVCTMAWNQHILTTGSKDGTIIHHDVRVKDHIVAKLRGAHSGSEICRLEYSPDFSYLATSDENGVVGIWDSSPTVHKPVRSFTPHTGPVKAMSWCPLKRHYLATGGYQDMTLKIHKTINCDTLCTAPTQSEITSLLWSHSANELATSHGHPSDSLRIWGVEKGDKLKEIADIKGHNERILHMSLSPDGQTAVTCSADETIRFWKIFSEPKKSKSVVQLAIR